MKDISKKPGNKPFSNYKVALFKISNPDTLRVNGIIKFKIWSKSAVKHLNILPTQPNGIPLSEQLLPEALKQCGYKTELIGKWHGGMFQTPYLPQYRGFDHFFGIYGGSTKYWTHDNW